MLIGMHLPIAAFVALAIVQPQSLAVVGAALTVEQFGYGFGFTAYMVYMMMVADGEHRTVALRPLHGVHGARHDAAGHARPAGSRTTSATCRFFLWVCLCTLPSFVAAALVRIDPAYGRKASPNPQLQAPESGAAGSG